MLQRCGAGRGKALCPHLKATIHENKKEDPLQDSSLRLSTACCFHHEIIIFPLLRNFTETLQALNLNDLPSVRTICPGGAGRKAPKTRKSRCGNNSVAAVFVVADGRKCLKSRDFRAKRKERQFYQNYRSFMVDPKGIEPSNLTDANRALSQLSYGPISPRHGVSQLTA